MNIYFAFIFLLIKHVFSDSLFQTRWMVEGKCRRSGWFLPTIAHAGIHGFWTAAVVAAFSKNIYFGIACGLFDTICHAAIDHFKSSPKFLGKYKSGELHFEIMFLDQMLHFLTYCLIVIGWRLYFGW